MLSELLCILKTEHDEFPKTAATFLQTKNSRNVVKFMLSANGSFGTYIYFGLEKALKLMINPKVYVKDVIEIFVNIDGVQIYKNLKQQFWPILIMLHDKKYIVKPQVVAIYHGESKPKSPTEFLNEFIEELLSLMTNKIKLSDKIYNIKVLGFICDTPARSFIKCVKSHVAFYACERCTVKGKTVGKNKRIYSRTTCEERNEQSFKERRQPQHHLDNEISPLLKIPGFDPVKSVVLDSMHLLFLGITKTLLNNIVFGGPKNSGIGPRNRLLLSNLLHGLSGQIPSEFQRKTFDIGNLKNWKATQFRFFLLYSGILVLRHVLPTDKYKHFSLLYVACRLLCSDDLAILNAENAKKLLILFFRLLPKFYGSHIQSINFHNLIHIADDVTHIGCSLTSFSAFPFENFLMTLKKLVRTPNNPLSQVANRLKEINLNTNIKIVQSISVTDYVKKKSIYLGNHMTKIIFKSITWNEMIITNTSPNNVVQLKNGNIIQINKIYSLKNDVLNQEKLSLKGSLYYDTRDVFNYPYKSSNVGLWQVNLSKYRCVFHVKEIKHKCVLLNIKNITYCTKLLHA
ncbi:uncharacterized protein [Linepithema humile]|uniref:uncharacterized protein n=1 Tax=Linepithema humile TaxID=83485 RepID=UPI00351E1B93